MNKEISQLLDSVDSRVNEAYERSELSVIEAEGALLAIQALKRRIFVENPFKQDLSRVLDQSPAADDL